ncbi:ATP-grasp ribosomal peptide maturase [Catenuloplanes japonicus]|uniref:ATP-grasp ribosomal peptide maturase n=1 Tax=Catenuloplanes japonicus TaxID=33876 RepID=UPI0005252562|nr:ATP-grasp ribosomal peptide maturase [Catenuloplanes japonicus]
MSGPRTVAVFTGECDVTADVVIIELGRRGVPVFRVDPAAFPAEMTMSARFDGTWSGRLRAGRRSVDVADVVCAWWRRPNPIAAPTGATEAEWTRSEAVAGFRGVLAVLPWLNHPDGIRAAEHKPWQLATAARVGLKTVPTLITNDGAEARAFAAAQNRIVYKPLTSGVLDDGRVVYARPVDPEVLDESIAVTAHLFQRQVPKSHELRVTVVDGRMFTARIDGLSELARQDWRADHSNVRYRADRLPDDVAERVRRFLALGRLRFAALDFVVTPGGEHVFLEANPNGQWAWIEQETGLPIAAAIADALESGRHD